MRYRRLGAVCFIPLARFQARRLAKNIAQSRHKDHPRQNRAMCMLNETKPAVGGVAGHLGPTI
jgi:hypothetical protein